MTATNGIALMTYSRIACGEREATYNQKFSLARACGEPETL